MKSTVKDKIGAVIQTLDKVTVKGKDNLDMLLGCILTLEAAVAEEEQEDAE